MRRRWTKEEAWKWYSSRPWVMGINYVPSITLHCAELWQEDTHDEVMKSVKKEFSLMEDIGLNSVRMFMPFSIWYYDREKFLLRLDKFLTALDKHGISMMPVIFNDCVGFGKPEDITNTGSSYTNRTEFYVDDVFFTAGEETPPETESFAVDFEQAGDLSLLLLNVDSDWAWPDRSISKEQAHNGNSSLKVVPRSDGGKWPIMVIKIGGNDTFDMTDYEEISLWVYNPSDTVIKNFGISVEDSGGKKKDAVKDIPSKEWTELKLTKEEIAAAGADITALKLSFSNMDSDYTNKTAFYIDDIKLA